MKIIRDHKISLYVRIALREFFSVIRGVLFDTDLLLAIIQSGSDLFC